MLQDSAGSAAIHDSKKNAPAAKQAAAVKASIPKQVGQKANRKLYKALKTGQVALRRKDFESAVWHVAALFSSSQKNLHVSKSYMKPAPTVHSIQISSCICKLELTTAVFFQLHHATKALEQDANNVDALKFRVTVLVAQQKADAKAGRS